MNSYKTSYLNFGIIDVFNIDLSHLTIHYRKLTPGNEYFKVLILDCQTRGIIHSESLLIYENVNHYTDFNYFRDIITKDILIQFHKDGKLIYNKKTTVYDTENITPVSDLWANQDHYFLCFKEIYKNKIYDENSLGVKVQNNDIVVDLGSNTGVFIMQCLDRGASKIYACEPNPSCIKILKDYFSQNTQVTINQCAIYKNDEPVDIMIGSDLDTSVLSALPELITEYHKNSFDKSNSIRVQGKKFLTFIKENNINYIDYLKVDIEGSERFIFCAENIDFIKNRVKKIVLEFHDGSDREIKETLERINFSTKIANHSMMYCLNNNL